MFPLFRHASFLNIWKIQYCERDFARCARYQRTLAAKRVEPNLLPNGELLALGKKEG